jgi:uncharacterized protein (TIGR03663 family)
MNESRRTEFWAWLILFLGAALHFYRLSEFPFHPDEAIHAWFALGLKSYHYDPTYHGPLLYHLLAATFAVIGASDFSARLVPAALGVLLLWLVLWPGRRFLEARAALWSGFFLAVSPVVVAYSRRLLHDSLVLVLTLGAVFCFQRTLEAPSTSREGKWARVALAAILALFLTTKANAFFIMAMLLAYWIVWKIRHYEGKFSFDWKMSIVCILVALFLWCALFRGDAVSALPHMIEYWSGQQKHPRLPGPHEYYFVLMALYELPLVVVGVWGAWRALRIRTPFTDLLLWWASTSLVLYAVANEKVPWLLAHQMLPLCLLGGYGIAQVKIETAARKFALGAVVFVGAIFLLRHIEATNFERAADRHEPLLFAQTTETYRDDLFFALDSTASQPQLGVWAESGEQWPSAWYLRGNSPLLGGSPVFWTSAPPDESTLRVVLCSPQTWQNLQLSGKFASWTARETDRYVWPRPGRKSLMPQRFFRFWWTRAARGNNGVLAEDATAQSVIAWKNR